MAVEKRSLPPGLRVRRPLHGLVNGRVTESLYIPECVTMDAGAFSAKYPTCRYDTCYVRTRTFVLSL